jgi:dipeptidyl aminopeptidase/acylaminoacyl peptidase
MSAGAGPVRKLTNLKGYVRDIRWSPDGKELAFLYAENGGGGGPLEAVPAQTGVIGSEIHNQRLAIVSATGGDVQQVSPAELNIYEYDWAPDGRHFAATAAPGPADNNWWIAQLYVVDASFAKTQSIYQPPKEQQLAVPRWSPDGAQIGFIGGLMSDEGFIGGDIFVIPSQGGIPRNFTAGRKASPSGFLWQNSSKLLFTEAVDGGGAISTLDITTGQVETLWRDAETVHQDGNYPNLSFAKDGRTSALIRSSWEQPPEIWAGAVGNWQPLTHANDGQRPHWGKAESII